jgi:hypothetical protein
MHIEPQTEEDNLEIKKTDEKSYNREKVNKEKSTYRE